MDLISRARAIDALKEAFNSSLVGTKVAVNAIEILPSAEKTGKWIRTAGDYIGDDVSGYYDYHWTCSECDREAITNDWNMYELSDYCPHCGAKMEI